MRKLTALAFLLMLGAAGLAVAGDVESELRTAVPYARLLAKYPGLTLEQYNAIIKSVASDLPAPSSSRYLGRLSANPYAPDSTANPYGTYGNPYSTFSMRN